VFPEHLTVAERKTIIDNIKDTRRQFIKNFTKPGHPGHCLQPTLHSLLLRITYPKPFTLLKSFYQTIVHLVHHQKRNISLCFRTFGTDLDVIPEEWNAFCEGLHPFFQNVKFNGKDGSVDLRLHPDNIGGFFRCGPNSEDCHLIVGTTLQPDVSKGEGIAFYNHIPNIKIYSGFKSIDNFLQHMYATGSVLAIRDYYPWWAACQEHYQSGKLLMIRKDEVWHHQPNRVRQVYFDDNLRISQFKEKHQLIADVRDIDTGNSYVNIEELFGVLLFRADAIDAIQDDEYFIKLVGQAESVVNGHW